MTFVVTTIGFTSSPFFYKLIVDSVEKGSEQMIALYISLYFGVQLFTAFLENVPHFIHAVITTKVCASIIEDVMSKLRAAGFAYHTEKASGKLLSKIKRGDNSLRTFMHVIFEALPATLVELAIALVTFAFFSWESSLALLIFIIVLLPGTYVAMQYNFKTRKRANESGDHMGEIQVDGLVAFENVLFFGKEDKERKELHSAMTDYTKKDIAYIWSFRWINLAVTIPAVPFLIAIGLIGYQGFRAGTINSGTFVLLISFSMQVVYTIWKTVYIARDYAKVHVDLLDYLSLLNIRSSLQEGKRELSKPKGSISLHDLTFRYGNKNKDALKNISLEIAPKETIALVGKSGGGKSTLAKLLMRLYDPTSGSIFFDGINLKDLTFDSLRKIIGIVPQEPILFNKSIAYNICYPKDNCTEQEMKEAARKACLTEFIDQLPEGYDTLVGERGIKLSGGQKQRLAIARAFIHDPKIIIFDEATSQLDSENEKYIQEALEELRREKTTIIIAHRLSTIMHADRIVVMNEGEIEEIGTHDQLLSKDSGIYKKLWGLQVGRELRN